MDQNPNNQKELTQLKLLALDSAIKMSSRSSLAGSADNDSYLDKAVIDNAKEIFSWLIEEVKPSPIVKLS